MDQNDPARQSFAQPSRSVPSVQHRAQLQQPQHGQTASQHILQDQQSFNPSVAQFPSAHLPSEYRTQGSSANPTLGSGNERAGSDNPNLYFSQNLQYGAGNTAQSQYNPGLGGRDEIKPQSQQSSGFGNSFGYAGMQSGLPQQMQQVAFDQTQQARHRSQATAETLPSQYEEPQGTQYYSNMQAGAGSTPTDAYSGSQFVQQYANPTYTTPGQSSSISSIPGTMIQSIHQSSYSSPQHQQQQQRQQQQQQQQHFFGFQQPHQHQQQQQTQHQLSTSNLTEGISQYQTAVRSIFTQIHNGSLQNVQGLLIDITRFLTSHVTQLGLTHDSEGRNDENHLKFWEEYNRAWLTTLQCQFDTAQAVISGRQSIEEFHIFDRATLDRLGDELVALGDRLEKHGLVDYQMGVAEDEIMEHILRCLTQLEALEPAREEQAAAGANTESESAN